MVARDEALARLDDRDRHAKPGEHLGQLRAGRSATQDEQAGRQLTGPGGVLVGPGPDRVDPVDRRDLRVGTHRDDHVGRAQLVALPVVADNHPARSGQGCLTPDDRRAGTFQAAHVAGVVRVVPILAIDHVVAPGRGPGPVVVRAGRMALGGVQERLRGNTAPERARSAEQVAVDHRHARSASARFIGRCLAAGAGADDHEVKMVHEAWSPMALSALSFIMTEHR